MHYPIAFSLVREILAKRQHFQNTQMAHNFTAFPGQTSCCNVPAPDAITDMLVAANLLFWKLKIIRQKVLLCSCWKMDSPVHLIAVRVVNISRHASTSTNVSINRRRRLYFRQFTIVKQNSRALPNQHQPLFRLIYMNYIGNNEATLANFVEKTQKSQIRHHKKKIWWIITSKNL